MPARSGAQKSGSGMSGAKPFPPTTKSRAFKALRSYAETIASDPSTNSVLRLAQDYFFALSDGEISTAELDRLVGDIGKDVFVARAERLEQQHEISTKPSWGASQCALQAIAAEGFEAYKVAVETPRAGVVFTAHPTFALAKRTRERLADAASGKLRGGKAGTLEHEPVTLAGEHADAQLCIENAQAACRDYISLALQVAKDTFPDGWRSIRPAAPTLASWVAYDLDGRDDITWWTTLSYRLKEKADQLRRYSRDLQAALALCTDKTLRPKLAELDDALSRAGKRADEQSQLFAADLHDPERLVRAANFLTEDHDDQLTDLTPVMTDLRAMAAGADDDLAKALIILATEMDLHGLGTARIHLRINAAQIQSVIRRDLGVLTENHKLGRVALDVLAQKIKSADPVSINFADLYLEQSTARRQFMLCAQILKHVDARTPIRFLIAESENPATVLGALYLARQYDVDRALDISPLFETPDALENGGRFIASLLDVEVFADYVRARNQLSVQLGFSDAGRFVGQVAANMAIERIHNLFARALSDALPKMRLLVFNTHGESMGRGGYPGTFEERLDHLLTPWTHQRCAANGVPLVEESSFQGGDGFLHFATDRLAKTAYDAIAAHALRVPANHDDPFYTKTNLVWDFYRALRNWQEALFDDPSYGVLLSGFAGGFRVSAGSRPQRRADGPPGPRSLRAISHNATLQQLAALANTAGGIGSSLRRELDALVELINASPRMRRLISLATEARILTSVPALRAYATAYSPSFWVACAKRATGDQHDARTQLAIDLKSNPNHRAIMATADHISIDLGRFDELIAKLDDGPGVRDRHELRLPLHVLHAIRIGAMMQAFEIAGSLPAISARYGFDVKTIKELILNMRLTEAADLICELYPLSHANIDAFKDLSETRSAVPGDRQSDYAKFQAVWVSPLRSIDALVKRITLAISHAHNAYG